MAIVNAPVIKHGNHAELCSFIDNLEHSLSSLIDSGQHTIEAVWTSIVAGKLNKRLEEEWLKYSDDTKKVPEIKALVEFLKKQLQYIPKATIQQSKTEVKSEQSFKRSKASVHPVNLQQETLNSCTCCGGEKHPLYLCPSYKAMTPDQKQSHVRSHNLCFNCLYPGHKIKNCKNTGKCHKCSTIVHREIPAVIANQTSATTQDSRKASDTVSINASFSLLEPTLQMTSQAILEGPDGKQLLVRALLDSGASISLVTRKVAKQLHLKLFSHNLSVVGAQGISTGTSHTCATFSIRTIRSVSPPMSLTAAVVAKVTCDLPLQGASGVRDLPYLKELPLADPHFDQPGRIDLLIGCNLLQDILGTDIRQGDSHQPVARKTIFGWAIMGRYSLSDAKQECSTKTANVCNVGVVVSSDDLLQRFWETEEVIVSTPIYTSEEKEVIEHFNSTYNFLHVGRYQVRLPKRSDASELGESRQQAVRRYYANEKSLIAKKKLQSFIQEYLDLNHAEAIPIPDGSSSKGSVYYLPMHAVYKDSSSTTKLRVVFDASAKSNNGTLLNDILMVGPTLYPSITDFLIRFRSYKVAISADISKMYRAVELNSAYRDLHHFVWRPNPSSQLKEYRMTRVTFGVSASAFVAIKPLQQTANDHGHQYPIAASHVFKSFYVDDCLAGPDTPDEALELHQELRNLLLKRGFNLRKWRSSSTKVMESIPNELHDPSHLKGITEGNCKKSPKALGIHWNSLDDSLYVSVGDSIGEDCCTKRQLISDIARIFDVLGRFPPTTILMKVTLQKLWELNLEWDEEIPVHIQDQYHLWKSQLHLLKSIPFTRCYYRSDSKVSQIQLHGFCDSSENAYAAVVYVKSIYEEGMPSLTLVAAKTKVTPLKQL